MESKTVFIAWNPKSSDDFQPTVVCTDPGYHWNDNATWGEGFSTREQAEEDWESSGGEGACPEILEIGSEWDGLVEQVSDGLEILSPEDFAELCITETEEQLESPVFFEHCPRGFANELSFIAVESTTADDYRADGHYEELAREELVSRMAYGGECHAEADARGDNTFQNPPPGSYGLEIIILAAAAGGMKPD